MDYDPDMEVRVVRLEQAMESVQSDIRDIKIDLRGFRAEFVEFKCSVKDEFASVRKEVSEKFDSFRKEFNDKFESFRKEFDNKFDSYRKEFDDKLEAHKREQKADLLKAVGLLASLMLGLAGMMARGFGWL